MTHVGALETGPAKDPYPIKKLPVRDRIKVIQAYRNQPSYRILAEQFKCSVKEIKTIHLKGKRRIFGEYVRRKSKEYLYLNRVSSGTDYYFGKLLEKIVYEWFQRAQRHPESGTITNELILTKAKEARRILPMKDVRVDLDWVVQFRQKHDITDLDMTMLILKNNGEPVDLDMYEIAVDVLDQLVTPGNSSTESVSESSESEMEYIDQNSSDSPQMTNEHGKYVTLSMRDRIRVIQAYKKEPSYNVLAKQFNCSPTEIRNIHRRGRQRVLMEYIKKETKKYLGIRIIKPESENQVAEFLEKVVYEWFQRAQRQSSVGRLTNSLILKKAQEAKRILPIASFKPSLEWVSKFREKYEITDLEMTMIKLRESDKPTDLDMFEIAVYLLDQLSAAAAQASPDVQPVKVNPNLNRTEVSDVIEQVCKTSQPHEQKEQVGETFQPPEEDFDWTRDSLSIKEEYSEGEEEPKMLSIENDEQAQRHLKPLEDYALMKGNYRAIGVIDQLRVILSGIVKEEP